MITTRFAPSPTGHLHIGGLRTALYSYLHARAKNGKFLLRIEDTDTERNSKEALDGILEAFKWVGLEYDSPMLFQSERTPIYQQYAQKLLDSKHAYHCYLTKDELAAMRTQNKGANHANCSRKYRDFIGEVPKDIAPCVRIKAPLEGVISFEDGVKGNISFQASELDDFVILRSDGTPTYNFVVAIDDALSGITDIIRGDDHISNTPKQLLVYKALGFDIPRFYHIPMICNEQGKKLSKRDGALSVLEYRDSGVLPEALLNFLFKLGYGHGDKEIFSLQEMIECFDPHRINSNPSGCNFSKLYWLNAEYIKAMDNEKLAQLLNIENLNSTKSKTPTAEVFLDNFKGCADSCARSLLDINDEAQEANSPKQTFLESAKKTTQILETLPNERKNILLNELKTRVNDLISMRNAIAQILNTPLTLESENMDKSQQASYDKTLYNKLFTQDTKAILEQALSQFIDKLQNATLNIDSTKSLIQEHANNIANTFAIKPSIFMQALRLGLLGQKGGIDLGACLCVLDKDESIKRIQNLIEFAKQN